MTKFPKLVANLCTCHDAWVVGSAAKGNVDTSLIRDWDVCVPFSKWRTACTLIPMNAVPNRFGGWKCISEGISVDVWPDDVADVMQNAVCKYLWHPRSGARFAKQDASK